MHWVILIALWAFLGYVFMNIVPLDYFYYTWVPTGIALLAYGIYMDTKKEKERLDEKNRSLDIDNWKKRSLQEQYGLPIDCLDFQYLSGYNKISEKGIVNIWIKEEALNFLSKNRAKYQIPLSDINFYSTKGDIRQEVENVGGDATLGETIMAEGMLGTAAAMRRNQVIQNIETIDERKTIINATIDGEISFIFFEGAELYNYLLESLPEKEQSFVAMNK